MVSPVQPRKQLVEPGVGGQEQDMLYSSSHLAELCWQLLNWSSEKHSSSPCLHNNPMEVLLRHIILSSRL